MIQCPYCMAEIPDEARKCKHCGEWVKAPPPAAPVRRQGFFESDNLPNTLNEGIKLGVKAWVVFTVIGLILFLALFFGFFLPQWNKMDSKFESFPPDFHKR